MRAHRKGGETVTPTIDARTAAPASAAIALLRRSWLLLPVVVALVLRMPRLGFPAVPVYDEVFYVLDAIDLLRWGTESGLAVHPPLGKWLIASGMAAFGVEPLGWRMASVLAGVGLVLVAALIGRLVTGRRLWGAVCGGLVACDGLLIVTSRLALLDGFVALSVAGVAGLLLRAQSRQPLRDRSAAGLVGAVIGIGAAVKWSTLATLPVALGMLLMLDQRLVAPGPLRRRAMVGTVVAVLGVAGSVYAASWLPRAFSPDPIAPRALAVEHLDMLNFHLRLEPRATGAAAAWTWLGQLHPVVLFRTTCTAERMTSSDKACVGAAAGDEVRIVALANPAVWAAGVLATVALMRQAIRGDPVGRLLLALLASQWLPWLLSPRRDLSFYAAAIVPLTAVATVHVVHRYPTRQRRAAASVLLVTVAVATALWYPVWIGEPLPPAALRARAWLSTWQW